MKPIYMQKRRKALNPAFKRFQNLPHVAASKPPGQSSIPAAVLIDCAALPSQPAAGAPSGDLIMMRNE